jgi:hypothetical protein
VLLRNFTAKQKSRNSGETDLINELCFNSLLEKVRMNGNINTETEEVNERKGTGGT